MATIKRGDRVRYGSRIYYFQPNGTSCYLYLAKEDVGTLKAAVFAPRREKVTPLTLDEIDRLDGKVRLRRRPSPRQPLSMDHSEAELAQEFVAALDGRLARVAQKMPALPDESLSDSDTLSSH
jgi:hypothetical protein